jgi:hypothetical protein
MFKMMKFYDKWFKQPLTVACDKSPFWDLREELFHCNGLWRARRIAARWVRKYSYGQARILEGHLSRESLRMDKLRKKILDIILAHDLYEHQIVLGKKPTTRRVTVLDCIKEITDSFEEYLKERCGGDSNK